MKALQDKVKQLEEEKIEWNNKLHKKELAHERIIDDMRRKFNEDMKESIENENSLKKNLNEIMEEVNKERIDGNYSKSIQNKYENEVNVMKIQINKFKEDLNETNSQMLMFKKEINIIENEKSKHIEQNSLDRDEYDEKLDDILSKLKQREDYIVKIEKEIKSFCSEKNELQNNLNKIFGEKNLIDNKMKQKIEELDKKLKECNQKNLEYHNMIIDLQERLEIEMITSQKKITAYEEKIKGSTKSYEELINVSHICIPCIMLSVRGVLVFCLAKQRGNIPCMSNIFPYLKNFPSCLQKIECTCKNESLNIFF